MKVDLAASKDLIMAFVLPARRARYIALLESKHGVKKFRSQLAHFRDFDPRFVLNICSQKQNPIDIQKLLRGLGAPDLCCLLSENKQLDGNHVDLHSALKAIVGRGFGSAICCQPGKLAYYEGEAASNRFILVRK